MATSFHHWVKSKWNTIAPDPYLGWRYRKNAEWSWMFRRGKTNRRIYVSTNSSGFRDHDHEWDKKSGTIRILLVGNSILSGMQVNFRNTVTSRLAEKLRQMKGGLIEVINASVTGWTNDQMMLYCLTEGWRYQPDFVFFSVSPTDILPNFSRGILKAEGNELSHTSKRLSRYDDLVWDLSTQNICFEILRQGTQLIRGRKRDMMDFLRSYYPRILITKSGERLYTKHLFVPNPPPEVESAYYLLKLILRNLKDSLTVLSSRLILIPLPTLNDFRIVPTEDRIRDAFLQEIKRLSTQLKIERIPVVEELRATASPESLFFENDLHLNESGHSRLANILSQYIIGNI